MIIYGVELSMNYVDTESPTAVMKTNKNFFM